MKKIFALGILALLTGHCLSGDKASKAREREYFKAPDYWELTLGDQKDYIESQVEKYCAKNKLDSQ
jgi:hypothetical protein